jgi:hypothetical protein
MLLAHGIESLLLRHKWHSPESVLHRVLVLVVIEVFSRWLVHSVVGVLVDHFLYLVLDDPLLLLQVLLLDQKLLQLLMSISLS